MTIQRYDIGFGKHKGPDYVDGVGVGVPEGPAGEVDIDTGSPPNAPRNFTVSFAVELNPDGTTQVAAALRWDMPASNVDGSPFTAQDVREYRVSYRHPNLNEAWSLSVPTQDQAFIFYGLKPGESAQFAVRVVDEDGQNSPWNYSIVYNDVPKSNGPPPTPSTPTLTPERGELTLVWDGKSTAAATASQPVTGWWPLDYAHVEVHASADQTAKGTFTPSASTLRTTAVVGGRIPIVGFAYNTSVWVRLVAVDLTGEKSGPSGAATAIPVPLVAADITLPAITYEALDGSLQADINNIQVALDKATAADGNATTANQNASIALTAANGKSTVYYALTAPVGTADRPLKLHDLWFDVDDGYKPYRYNTSSQTVGTVTYAANTWHPAPLGDAAISGIDAGKITAGEIDAARIGAKTITTDKLVVGGLTDALNVNPNFEVIAAGQTMPDRFSYDTASPYTGAAYTVDTTNFLSGVRGVRCTIGSGLQGRIRTERVAVVGGQWVITIAQMRGAGTGYVGMIWRDSAGNQLASPNGLSELAAADAVGITTAFKRAVFHAQAPAAARYAESYVRVEGGSGTVFTVDDLELRRAVGSAEILNASINTAHIGTLTVQSSQIASLAAGKIAAGTLSADITMSSRIKTADTGARVEMDGAGIRAYRLIPNTTTAELIADISTSATSNFFAGRLRSGINSYIQLTPATDSGTIDFKLSGVANSGAIRMGTFGSDALTPAGASVAYNRPAIEIIPPSTGTQPSLILAGPGNTTATNHTTAFLNVNRFVPSMTEGIEYRNPQATYPTGFTGAPTSMKLMKVRRGHDERVFNNQTLVRPTLYHEGDTMITGLGGVQFSLGNMIYNGDRGSGAELQARPGINWPSTSFSAYAALEYRNTSAREYKTGIKNHTITGALDACCACAPTTFRTDWLPAHVPDMLGFVADMLPDHLQQKDEVGNPIGYSVNAMLAHMWVALQEVAHRLEALEGHHTEPAPA